MIFGFWFNFSNLIVGLIGLKLLLELIKIKKINLNFEQLELLFIHYDWKSPRLDTN